MRPRHPDQALAPDEFGSTVLEHVPELRRLAEIEIRVLFNLDSSDLGPWHWMEIAHAVHEAHGRYDGVVVTHGTDAMSYTAAALSFLLRGLPFPVILTGSQRPLDDVHSDGRGNLLGAVDLALRPIPEVGIFFDGLLLRGNRAVKVSTFAFGAFRSPDFPPLAEIGTEVRLTEAGRAVLKRGAAIDPGAGANAGTPAGVAGPFRVEGTFEPRVAVSWVHPGDDGASLRRLTATETAAVLLAAFGYGNIPSIDRACASAISELVEAGKVVAVGSQSLSGSVDLARYAGGRLAMEMGAVGIGDMTLAAATVKLMYLCGTVRDADAVRRALPVPIAGEITA